VATSRNVGCFLRLGIAALLDLLEAATLTFRLEQECDAVTWNGRSRTKKSSGNVQTFFGTAVEAQKNFLA